MPIYVLVLVVFLTQGQVVTKVAAGTADEADCKAAATQVEASWQDKRVTTAEGEKLLVLDAQAFCIPVTQHIHA